MTELDERFARRDATAPRGADTVFRTALAQATSGAVGAEHAPHRRRGVLVALAVFVVAAIGVAVVGLVGRDDATVVDDPGTVEGLVRVDALSHVADSATVAADLMAYSPGTSTKWGLAVKGVDPEISVNLGVYGGRSNPDDPIRMRHEEARQGRIELGATTATVWADPRNATDSTKKHYSWQPTPDTVAMLDVARGMAPADVDLDEVARQVVDGMDLVDDPTWVPEGAADDLIGTLGVFDAGHDQAIALSGLEQFGGPGKEITYSIRAPGYAWGDLALLVAPDEGGIGDLSATHEPIEVRGQPGWLAPTSDRVEATRLLRWSEDGFEYGLLFRSHIPVAVALTTADALRQVDDDDVMTLLVSVPAHADTLDEPAAQDHAPPPPGAVEVVPLAGNDTVSPIDEQLSPPGASLDYARQVNSARAACLVERGWPEHTAPVPEGADDPFTGTVDGLRTYAATAGFGFATMWVSPEAGAHQATGVENATWIAELTPDERARYGADSGECMRQAERDAPEAGASQSPASVAALKEAKDWVAAHPQVVDATQQWSRCMADAGYDATSPESFRDSFADFGVTIEPHEGSDEIVAAVTATDCAIEFLWSTTRAVELVALAQMD